MLHAFNKAAHGGVPQQHTVSNIWFRGVLWMGAGPGALLLALSQTAPLQLISNADALLSSKLVAACQQTRQVLRAWQACEEVQACSLPMSGQCLEVSRREHAEAMPAYQ